MIKEFEIYWGDLTKETQKELYKFLGNENGNYDVFPITTIVVETEDDEERQYPFDSEEYTYSDEYDESDVSSEYKEMRNFK